MPEDRIVMCMKWGTLYPAEYVNVLFNAVRAHLTGDFRFVCLTDDARGLDPGIQALPIPEIGCTPPMWRHGAWPKLGVFSADLHGLRGRALFIDLDTVICGPLDDFLTLPGRLIVLDGGQNWRPGSDGRAAPLVATGIFAFTLGTLGHIVTEFQRDPMGHFARDDLEQAFVGRMVPDVAFWPAPWVQSFKRHLRQPIGLDRLRPPRRPPPQARVIAFHGEPRPIALVRGGTWAKFPRAGRGRWTGCATTG
jgi:hypothetical protein